MSSFSKIIAAEAELSKTGMKNARHFSSFTLKQTVSQLQEIATSNLVRCPFNQSYQFNPIRNVAKGYLYPDSIAAHTEVATAIFERALLDRYGQDFGEPGASNTRTSDGYTYRQAMEAARIYNLPNNKADISDGEKELYFGRYAGNYGRGTEFGQKIVNLTGSPDSDTGKMIRLSYKTAAIFMSLIREKIDSPDTVERGCPLLSESEKQIARVLPTYIASYVKVSQLLLYKYFKTEKLTDLDETGFFTALIVTIVLTINNTWPSWREEDYMK